MSTPRLTFLVDVGVGRAVESYLCDQRYDVKAVGSLDPRMDDHEIIRLAVSEKRMIVTMVIDEIGNDEDGTPIEILFGALAMQQWGIRLIPDEEKLDLTRYPEEFLEYSDWMGIPIQAFPITLDRFKNLLSEQAAAF